MTTCTHKCLADGGCSEGCACEECHGLVVTEEILLDAAQFSSFAQRVKMAYWTEWDKERTSEPSGNLCREKELDRILIHAWNDLRRLANKE